jgi:hypothetical protein
MYKKEYFTKTGSGQTQGKLKIKDRLSSGRVRRRCSLRQRPLILSVWSTFRTSPRRARPRWRSFCSPGMRCTCRLTGSITSSQRAPPSGEMAMRMVAPFSVFLAENGHPLFCLSQSVSFVGVDGLPRQARDSTQGNLTQQLNGVRSCFARASATMSGGRTRFPMPVWKCRGTSRMGSTLYSTCPGQASLI